MVEFTDDRLLSLVEPLITGVVFTNEVREEPELDGSRNLLFEWLVAIFDVEEAVATDMVGGMRLNSML